MTVGTPGVLHGTRTYLLQDGNGQIQPTHSISAGLDYPGVGPEHAWLKDSGRAQYVAVTDAESLIGFRQLAEYEGIIPGNNRITRLALRILFVYNVFTVMFILTVSSCSPAFV